MITVPLVKVVVGLGTYLERQLFQYAGEHGVDRVCLGGVAVPDGDEVGVEANGEADATELVVLNSLLVKRRQVRETGRGAKP